MKQVRLLIQTQVSGYETRLETLEAVEYTVIPVTIMVEGVHHGSAGAIFHSIDELGKFPDSWNGRPIVVDHPKGSNGEYVSANDPDIFSARKVGFLFNTKVKDQKLVSEAWTDTTKLSKISAVAANAINKKDLLEVSVGVFTDVVDQQGNWNNEKYEAVAVNHRPDHLALLPGGRGACSIEDGCGLGVNNKTNEKGGQNVEVNDDFIKGAKKIAIDFVIAVNANNPGFFETINLVGQAIDGLDSADVYHTIEEIYADYVIFKAHQRVGGSKLFKQSYKLENNRVELTGTPEEVQKTVSYKIKNNSNKTTMAKENCGQCMEKVIKIINSPLTNFTAADREWLLQQDETLLDKFMPNDPPAPTPTPAPQANTAPQLNAEDQAALAFGRRMRNNYRQNLIKGIVDNTKAGLWPEDLLKTYEDDFLQKLFESVTGSKSESETNFSLNAALPKYSFQADEDDCDEEPLPALGFKVNTTKK